MNLAVPAVCIAAPASGAGKTTIATGLMSALARTREVAPFKVGPDYIDPGYHSIATGRPGRNLDSVLCQKQLIGPLYAHGSRGCDIAIIEGVMGLFDGRIPDGAGSTAEIASLLGVPVILVVDARRMSQSAGALVHGFASHHADVRIAGVIINNVASERHSSIVTTAVEAAGVPVVGAVPRIRNAEVPSRHLGLITAIESGKAANDAVTHMRTIVERFIDIDALCHVASCSYTGAEWSPAEAVAQVLTSRRSTAGNESRCRTQTPRIAIARGAAFSFSYAEHAELLVAAGVEVVEFDPLRDELPRCDGLVIPGGFPEAHLAELASRDDLRVTIVERARRGLPVHAECAGLLWLLESLDGAPMLGVLRGCADMTSRVRLGYRHAVACTDSILYRRGERVMGHEFHHTRLVSAPDFARTPAWVWAADDGTRAVDGYASETVHASYLHVHPAGAPHAVVRFVDECARRRSALPAAKTQKV